MHRDEIMRRVKENADAKASGKRVMVLPPLREIQHAGHHWLRVVRFGSGSFELRVLQWAPNEFVWYHSGEVATVAPHVNTDGWEYVAPCPYPEL